MIIILNGPPHCGKDTFARFAWEHNRSIGEFKMSQTLKSAIAALFALDHNEHLFVEKFKDNKEVKAFGTDGWSYRDIQIELAEEFMKKNFGQDVFGKIAVKRLSRILDKQHFVISDAGFPDEIRPIIRAMSAKHQCVLVKIERDGCDYSIDSRGWLNGKELGIREYTLSNHHDLELYRMRVVKWLREQGL